MVLDDANRESGYDQEEQYFYKLNKELIEKRRAALDEERKTRESEKLKEEHWMRCPKCGQKMEEIALEGIMVDRCGGCSGIYFDSGELELLLESREPNGFIGSLGRWIKGAK